MADPVIPSKRFCILSGSSGILGVVLLIISFNINPGPRPDATLNQLIEFGNRYYNAILLGAWLQAVAPVLIVLFDFSLVKLAGATNTLAGWMTMLGAVVLMIGILISLNTIHAVQHLYFIVAAPTLFISLGVVLSGSPVLQRVFSYFAFSIGISLGVIGMIFLLELVLPNWVTAIAGLQAIWWLAASISLMVRSGKLHRRYMNGENISTDLK